MRPFADLFERLDRTTSTNEKVGAMAAYFREAPAVDAAWGLYFLVGLKPKRLLSGPALARGACRWANIPEWLFNESYTSVGDLAETISLVMDRDTPAANRPHTGLPLSAWMNERLLPLRGMDEREQMALVRAWLDECSTAERFILLKLLTGSFRVGVSRTLVERALAQVAGVEQAVVAHRLMGEWQPTPTKLAEMLSPVTGTADLLRPYPFFLASPLQDDPATLGDIGGWSFEWKWDGIRAQLVRRGGAVAIWSRGDELITERFPEVADAAHRLADGTVIDGEMLAWREGRPMPFAALQRRIGRIAISREVLRASPAAMVVYDLLEDAGRDLRETPLHERRARLAEIVRERRSSRIVLAPDVRPASWDEAATLRLTARERGVEGLMIKRRASPYASGRTRGDWWKWKIDPYHVDAVLVYAEPGHGRRANLLTDYTFALWDGDELVPVAKAYSGLSQEEINELDGWIRRHSSERFGPVRVVKPQRVFELHFEDIRLSDRHRSGVAVRFPRIARERTDKKPADADRLETLRGMMTGETEEKGLFG